MAYLTRLLFNHRRQLAVIAALAFATAVCLVQLAVRAVYARSTGYSGLVWNLFLAWLPMLGALLAYNLGRRGRWRDWLLVLPCLVFWLLFFPNAPYILTDILHLQPRGNVPLWYDLILLISFAWTGAFLGLISLYLMQSLVRRSAGVWVGWMFALGVLALSGFGVYLGRFPRWSSWDVLANPSGLLLDIAHLVRNIILLTENALSSSSYSFPTFFFSLQLIIQPSVVSSTSFFFLSSSYLSHSCRT